MNTASDAHGFIALYPDGYESSWNAGLCCGAAADEGIDDVGFLEAVLDHASARLCVDRARVYATGMSNGGYMSHRLGCEAADVFAAVAPVAGGMGIATCSPSRPVPVVAYHGTEDPLVSYDMGRSAVLGWVSRNGCSADPVRTDHGDSFCETWGGCDGGVEVVLCTLDPMGHCWPGGSDVLCLPALGAYNDDIDANEHMWTFFEGYALEP
jgi:polyhydroxybutyrate depolymerase